MYPRALMRGYPPSTTSTRLSLVSPLKISQFPFIPFLQQIKGKGAQIPWARSAPQPDHPHNTTPQNIYHLYTAKGKLHTVPRHFASPRVAGGMPPLRFAKPLIHSLTLFLLWYWLDGRRRGGILRSRRSRSYWTRDFIHRRITPLPLLWQLRRLQLWMRYGAWWTSVTSILPSTFSIGILLGSSMRPKIKTTTTIWLTTQRPRELLTKWSNIWEINIPIFLIRRERSDYQG